MRKRVLRVIVLIFLTFVASVGVKAETKYETTSYYTVIYQDLSSTYFRTYANFTYGQVNAKVGPCNSEWIVGGWGQTSEIYAHIYSGCHVHGVDWR